MNRYQVQTRFIGEEGQRRIQGGHVVVVGCGALGIPVSLYLAGAGIGKITLIDGDRVSLTNLHRQPIYTEATLGQPKAIVLKTHLEKLNAEIEIQSYDAYLTAQNIEMLIPSSCILVDAGDNFELTYLLNDYAYLKGIPLVYGAVYRDQGMVATFCATEEKLNFRDVFDSVDASVCNCTDAGVLGPIAGVIGSLMAQEVLNYFLFGKTSYSDSLLFYSASEGNFQRIRYKPNSANPLRTGEISTLISKVYEVSWEDYFRQKVEGILVDVRTQEERELFSIPEAHWIPFPAVELEEIARKEQNKIFYCFCETGTRSGWIARTLREKGFLNVYSIRGGLVLLKEKEEIR